MKNILVCIFILCTTSCLFFHANYDSDCVNECYKIADSKERDSPQKRYSKRDADLHCRGIDQRRLC